MLGALVRFGVRVPDHLSLVCHEEAPFFAYWHPPITVVDNAPRDLGELAAEQLLRRIEKGEAGRGGTSRSLRVGAQLVVRRSTAAWQPPAARPGDDG